MCVVIASWAKCFVSHMIDCDDRVKVQSPTPASAVTCVQHCLQSCDVAAETTPFVTSISIMPSVDMQDTVMVLLCDFAQLGALKVEVL